MPDPAHLENNTLLCFPVRWTPPGATSPIIDFFHKYVVTEVRDGDLTGGAPDVVHDYDYIGGAAWHYSDDDGLIGKDDKTWSAWRGYATVRVRAGDAAINTQSRTDTEYYRGMNGDHLPSGTRSVTLAVVDVNSDGDTTDAGVDAPGAPDDDSFAGMVRATHTYNGTAGVEISGSVNEAWESAPTATRTINNTTVSARFVNVAAAHGRTALDTDGGTRAARVRTTSSVTTFDAYGMPVELNDRGDDSVTGDERCALTDYSRTVDVANGVWLTGFASRVRTFATDCTTAKAGGLVDAQVIAESRSSFDGQAYGGAPVTGLVTAVQALKRYDAGSPTFLTTSRSQFDVYGRTTDTWDVLNDHTAIAYTPATVGPVTSVVTTNPFGWTSTVNLDPAWGFPTSLVDFNGKRTDGTRDGLGRVTAMWLPGQDKASLQAATATFAYLVRVNGANVVTTNMLKAGGGYRTSIKLYDGLLRNRQIQEPDASVAGNRIVTDAFYDSSGRSWKQTAAYPMVGAPATDIYTPKPPDFSGPEALPAWTVRVFDGAGRITDSVLYSHNVEKWRTTTAYGGDRVATTPPAGGTAAATVTDAQGRQTQLRQYLGGTPSGAYNATTYTLNNKDQLTRVTDSAGNHWDYTYDTMNRQIQAVDPDKGTSTTTYDDASRVVTTTDARNTVLALTYDALSRKTSLRDASTTGPVRASWTYDTVAKGQLTKAARFDAGGNAYSTEVQSYSARYQPGVVKYSLPASETGFGATSFSYTYGYNPDGSPTTDRIPAAGGIGLETLTDGYDSLGQAATLNTSLGGTLVTGTGYTNYGELGVMTLRNNNGPIAQIGQYREEGTHRLVEIKTTSAAGPTTYQDVNYTYDASGNLKKSDETISGDHQCFSYDALDRLTQAWTPSSNDCNAAPMVAGLGGPAPYWQSWTFDSVGDRLTQVDHASTDTTATSSYPTAGSVRPHAQTQVSYTGATTRIDSYGYDDIGDVATRPGGTAGQTLTWDAEGHLTQAVDSTGTTSYIYDADGNRLIRKDPIGKTLYLPNQEIRVTTATGAVSCVRYYAYAGQTIATRSSAGLTWLSGDRQGTASLTITATTQVTAIRRMTPYGSVRGVLTGWLSTMDKGFIGGTVDATSLTHLGAREFDPTTGRFVSVDPVQDLGDPQQWNGYAYGNNNPTTFSDPSGNMYQAGDTPPPVQTASWGAPLTDVTKNGVRRIVDQNGYPHVVGNPDPDPGVPETEDFLNQKLKAAGQLYDPGSGQDSGSVYLQQNDRARLAPPGQFNTTDGPNVTGTTADLIKVSYIDGKIVSVDTVDVTTSDRKDGTIDGVESTVRNKLPGGGKSQAQSVIFFAKDQAQADLVTAAAGSDPNVRVINVATGYDSSGETLSPTLQRALRARGINAGTKAGQPDTSGRGKGGGGSNNGNSKGGAAVDPRIAIAEAFGLVGDLALIVDLAINPPSSEEINCQLMGYNSVWQCENHLVG
jgi:RHS repeat-associated protein